MRVASNPGRWWELELDPPAPDRPALKIALEVQSLGRIELRFDLDGDGHFLELTHHEAFRLAQAFADLVGCRLEQER